MTAQPIRVLIIEDSATFIRGLSEVLAEEEGIEVAATATSTGAAELAATTSRPDVVLLDLRLPTSSAGSDRHESHGLKLLAALRESYPALKLLVLTSLNEDHILLAAINSGADGYLSKDEPPDRIVTAIRHVAAGNIVLTPQQLALVRQARQEANLSSREREILVLLAEGLRNKEIADRLVIAEGTVKKHIEHILSSMSAGSRLEAVAKARRLGLI